MEAIYNDGEADQSNTTRISSLLCYPCRQRLSSCSSAPSWTRIANLKDGNHAYWIDLVMVPETWRRRLWRSIVNLLTTLLVEFAKRKRNSIWRPVGELSDQRIWRNHPCAPWQWPTWLCPFCSLCEIYGYLPVIYAQWQRSIAYCG